MRHTARIYALLFIFLGGLVTARAEEVRIGHLETNDDLGINWLYFRCDKSSTTQMKCDIFQTLIMKKDQSEIDAQLKRAAADPLAEFNTAFGKGFSHWWNSKPKCSRAFKLV